MGTGGGGGGDPWGRLAATDNVDCSSGNDVIMTSPEELADPDETEMASPDSDDMLSLGNEKLYDSYTPFSLGGILYF